MSDLLNNILQAEDKTINNKKYRSRKKLDSPILYSTGQPRLTILADVPYTDKQIYGVKTELSAMGLDNNYQIVSVLKFKPTDKDISKDITKFYTDNKFNLEEYIPAFSNVITIGRSLYSVTESDDVNIEGFKDTLLWETHFFSPDLKCDIYPIDGFQEWYKKDNFEYFFVKTQIDLARKNICKRRRIPKLKKHYVENPNEWLEERKDWKCKMAWDLETKRLHPWLAEDGKIICLTIAFDSKEGYYLPWDKIDVDLLSSFMKPKKHIGTNLKYDQRWLVSRGVDFDSLTGLFWDTFHASQTINELQRNGLKSDTWVHTEYGGYDRDLDRYKAIHKECRKDYSKIPFKLMFEYATQDPIMSFAVCEKQIEMVERLDTIYPMDNGWSIMRYLREIRFPSTVMYSDIEIKGMMVNLEQLKENSKVILQEVAIAEKIVLEAFGNPVLKLSSNDDLGRFIEKNTDWRIDERNKKGIAQVGSPQLTRWVKQGHDKAKLILTYKEKSTLLKNFVGGKEKIDITNNLDNNDGLFNSLLTNIESHTEEGEEDNGLFQYVSKDGLIHGTFMTMLANSHRNRSRDPNLQNQPSHGSKAFFIRQAFTCPEDGKFLSSDYSGLQLRIAGILSNDPEMRKVFLELGGDMHSMTAQSTVLNNSIPFADFMRRKGEGESFIIEARYRAKACFVEGTRILTEEGIQNIEDIVPKIEKGNFVKYHGETKTMNRTFSETPNYSIYKEVSETILFELDNGDNIEVTPDHLMIVIRGDKEIKVPASEIIDSDEVIIYGEK
ncbi:MAG: DNA polymerase [Candidatus Woesearchaeota archaeon]|nr:DNA polymerase [Candidatus Woesearchaeota archaeon]